MWWWNLNFEVLPSLSVLLQTCNLQSFLCLTAIIPDKQDYHSGGQKLLSQSFMNGLWKLSPKSAVYICATVCIMWRSHYLIQRCLINWLFYSSAKELRKKTWKSRVLVLISFLLLDAKNHDHHLLLSEGIVPSKTQCNTRLRCLKSIVWIYSLHQYSSSRRKIKHLAKLVTYVRKCALLQHSSKNDNESFPKVGLSSCNSLKKSLRNNSPIKTKIKMFPSPSEA